MRFRVLGSLEVWDATGRRISVGGPRQRTVLAALLMRRGEVAPVDRLVDDVWGEDLPGDPERTLRTYVSRIRSALGDPERLTREGSGYRLTVAEDELDLSRFERLAVEGRVLLAAGDVEPAAERLREALNLWRGEPLADLGAAPLLGWVRAQLQEAWFATLQDRVDADLAARRCGELVAELRTLVERYPLRERLVGQLMRALYGDGRQAEALEVFRDARERLVDELGVGPSADLVDVHERVLRHDASLAPIDRPATPEVRHDEEIPPSLTSFIGREGEIVAVGSLLEEARCVTLTGIGGSGKTRLALELANRRVDRYADGIRLAALASVDGPSDVVRAVARAVGLPVTAADPRSQLGAWIGDRELLLVIDNCEQVREAVARLVEHLLRRCRGLRVLATSRRPLGVAGERIWRLRPLRVPPDGQELSTQEIAAYEAVRLFEERARAADARFALDDRTVVPIAQVCRCVAGIPLAIELAASRVRALTIDELAARVRRSLLLLRSTSPTADDRHRTLEATLDWSYALLEEPARALLRRLAVFRSAFPLSGAEEMAVVDGGVGGQVAVDLLDLLVACSLVEADPWSRSSAPYRLLEPVRLYAAGRLAEEGSEDAVRSAHASWWLKRMQTTTAELRQGRAPRDITTGGQIDDLRAALRWAIDSADADLAQRLVGVCCVFWWAYGLMREGIGWARQALELHGDRPPEVRGAALAGLALLEIHVGAAAARRHAQEARRLLETVPGEDRPVAYLDALQSLSYLEITSGDLDTGERLAAEVIGQGWRHDDRMSLGMARTGLGLAAKRRGDLEESYARFERLHRDTQEQGSTLGAIATTYHMGMVALERGQYELARRHLERVIRDKERSGSDPFGQGHGYLDELAALVRACLGVGDVVAGRTYALEGAATARRLAAEEHRARFERVLTELGDDPQGSGIPDPASS